LPLLSVGNRKPDEDCNNIVKGKVSTALAVIIYLYDQWAWNKTTGESLGGVLFIRGSQVKIRRSGERFAKFYPLQQITI
jgi:hypothetical protein